MSEGRTVCRTPTPGKKPTSIPTWKYEAFREAILTLVPRRLPGAVAKDLPTMVRDRLSDEVVSRLGSVAWHTTTVKLEMEVAGEIERVPGVTPQHLIRVPVA